MMYSNTSNPISPTDVSLREFIIAADTTLVWPFAGLNNSNTIARIMIVSASAPSLSLLAPPANQGAVGFTTIVINIGSSDFSFKDNAGNVIDVVGTGQVKVIALRTNLTIAGAWLSYTLGATTSAANAAMLAGLGLKVIASTLNVDYPVNSFSSTQGFSIGDRAQFNLWTGGVGSALLDPVSTLSDGWWASFRNAGSGALTLTPTVPDLIDDATTEILNPGDSCLIFCTGTGFYTVGIGRSLAITDSQANVNVAGSIDVTLTPTDYANNILNFIGVLGANINVIFPNAVKNYWLRNNTTGAFSLTAKTAAGTGVIIAQGGSAVVTCDGTNIDPANSTTSGTVTSITAGVGLNGGVITGSGTISIANTGAVAGNYGDVNNYPVLGINSQGQITTASQLPLPSVPTGVLLDYWGTTAPSGWLLASGLTIGGGASNGTGRANADTSSLYTLLWNSTTTSELPIYTSLGVLTTKGASAAADFAASKAISLPDYRGRVSAGKDDMGGTAANRITNTNGVVGMTLGSGGGEQTHTLITGEIPAHTHANTYTEGAGHTHGLWSNVNGLNASFIEGLGAAGSSMIAAGINGAGTNYYYTALLDGHPWMETVTTGGSITNASAGGGAAHNNLQPTIIANKIIKL